MEKYIEDLTKTTLFSGIEQLDMKKLLACIQARIVGYKKNELIVEQGSKVYNFGIMLSGHGRAFKVDTMGKVIIITLLQKYSEIGVILAASFDHKSPVSVQAQEDLSVLLIPYDGLITRCKKNCPQHDRLLRNYINIVAERGLVLHERIDCLLKPTVREKILSYLTRVSCEQNSRTIFVPIDRYAMSEYLNIERSALSRELSQMKRDEIIDFHKNVFKLM